MAGDPVLLNGSPIEYRMDSLLRMRKNAILAGQHGETIRLGKELMLLRGALGLDPILPEETIQTQRNSRDPSTGNKITLGSEVEENTQWIRRATIRGIANIQKKLEAKGYSSSIEEGSSYTKYVWQGFANSQKDVLVLTAVGRDWVLTATRNGKNLPLFILNSSEEKPFDEVAADNLNRKIDVVTKQMYASDWTKLSNMIGE